MIIKKARQKINRRHQVLNKGGRHLHRHRHDPSDQFAIQSSRGDHCVFKLFVSAILCLFLYAQPSCYYFLHPSLLIK